MSDTDATGPAPLIKRAAEVEYETVEAADGLRKGVLVGDPEGAPNFAIRRFVLDPGATVPRHTNAVEHEQYVLEASTWSGSARRQRHLKQTAKPSTRSTSSPRVTVC